MGIPSRSIGVAKHCSDSIGRAIFAPGKFILDAPKRSWTCTVSRSTIARPPGAAIDGRFLLSLATGADVRKWQRPRNPSSSTRKIAIVCLHKSRGIFCDEIYTGCISVGELAMTPKISLVAVCCSNDSLSSWNSRTFSMAMTAWSAKVSSSLICAGVNGRTSVRRAISAPTNSPC